MKLAKIRQVLTMGGVVIITAVAGLLTGSLYGDYRAEASRPEKRAAFQNVLESNIEGIRAGQPLAELILYSPNEQRLLAIGELLPAGGD